MIMKRVAALGDLPPPELKIYHLATTRSAEL
jgi:hypothetical protein